MAFWGVTVEKIATVETHPDADRLDCATLEGMDFRFVTLRGQFKPGDKVVYFPIDSVLPEDIIQKLGLQDKLHGKNKNRIKTAKLRGFISQGVVCFPETLGLESRKLLFGNVLDWALGVTKYEPPTEDGSTGILTALPPYVQTYDILDATREVNLVEAMMDLSVFITEKVEGTNFGITIDQDDNVSVFQRNNAIIEKEGEQNWYWQAARDDGLIDKAKSMRHWIGGNPILTIRGELTGPKILGNHYKLERRTVYVFDIEVNGVPVDAAKFYNLTGQYELQTAPLIHANAALRHWLNGRSIQDASNGRSEINPDKAREGIVIKPMLETTHPACGRLFIKQRSPEYLAGTDN